MKRITTALISFAMLGFVATSNGQVSETFRISEINPMVDNYFKPFGRSLATGMGAGWTHTANVHKKLGFDVTFSGAVVMIPSSASTFNTSKIGMGEQYSFTDDNGNITTTSPTLRAKGNIDAPMIHRQVTLNGTPMSQDVAFRSIRGVGMAIGGSFALQAGVGLPFGTEIMGRFMPDFSNVINNTMSAADVDIKMEKTMMWGVGVKHDIKQWIPVISKVPFLEISGMLTYSRFTTGFAGDDLRFDPSRFNVSADEITNPNSFSDETWSDQKFTINMSSFTGSLLIGASIPVFQPFIGVGFNKAKFDGSLKGTYPVFEISADAAQALQFEIGQEKDPISITSNTMNFNFQAGARIKLGFFVFHYQFTKQEYTTHSGGLAFTFR